jgi:hypothetical protein
MGMSLVRSMVMMTMIVLMMLFMSVVVVMRVVAHDVGKGLCWEVKLIRVSQDNTEAEDDV